MKNKDIIDIIQKEIDWCENNQPNYLTVDLQYKEGFVKGLQQAIYLISKAC